jgi:UDPglucose 6-dehydrogenase
MSFNSVNIIGYGYVGSAVAYLCEKNNIKFNICDTLEKVGPFNYFSNLYDLVNYSEKDNDINYYIIAVPTPSDSDGNCDISIVHSVIKQISESQTKNTIVIIKSTLCPGTSLKLHNEFTDIDIIICPEFLTEKNYLNDIYNAKFILFGTKDFSMTKYQQLLKLFRDLYAHNKMIDIISKSYTECELFKYTLNTFFATKITFFNEIYELCESMDVDYQQLKTLFKLDNRIGEYGITVPGQDGYGYRKLCLPKEVKGLISKQNQLNLSCDLMTCVDKRNKYFNEKKI